MRILFFNAYYAPEIFASQYLCTDLCEDLARYGFDVEVYCPLPTRGVSDAVRREYWTRRTEISHEGRLRIHRVPLPKERTGSLGRAVRYVMMDVAFFAIAMYARADAVFLYSTPPTQGFLGSLVRKITKTPVVYNLQDIFPDSLASAGLASQGSTIYRLGQTVEAYIYRNVDKLVVISDTFRRILIERGVPRDRIEVIPNWVNEDQVAPIERDSNVLFDRHGLDRGKFYVSYCGNVGHSQDFGMLVDCATRLIDNPEIVFLVIGNGAYMADLRRLVEERSLRNFIMLPFQPYSDIAHVFSAGDVGLVISKAGVGESSVPSKTWNIMSAARPVLASFDIHSELSELLKAEECGVCVESGNVDAFVEEVLLLYRDQAHARSLGRRGRRFIIDNLTRRVGTARIIHVINELLERR